MYISFGSLLNSSKTDARSLVLIRPYRITIEAWLPNTERACFDEVHWLDQKTKIRNVYPPMNVFIENPQQSAQSAITRQLNPHLIRKFTGDEHLN